MSGRYLVCVKCVLLNRRNAPNKTTSKKTICKGCVKKSFILLFAGTLFIKKKKKCARSESAVCKWWVENSFITICFICSWYIIYKKKYARSESAVFRCFHPFNQWLLLTLKWTLKERLKWMLRVRSGSTNETNISRRHSIGEIHYSQYQ